MSSEKQILANRENATKSTGPRTPEGKARSSQNARKHGLTAQHVVAPGEDPAEFDSCLASYFEQHSPTTAEEADLVREMATAQWRLRRLLRVEAGLYAGEFLNVADSETVRTNPPGETPDERTTRCFGQSLVNKLAAFNSLARMENSLRRSYYKAAARLDRLRKEPKEILPPGSPSDEKTNPIFPPASPPPSPEISDLAILPAPDACAETNPTGPALAGSMGFRVAPRGHTHATGEPLQRDRCAASPFVVPLMELMEGCLTVLGKGELYRLRGSS